jgi:hypothetical protein
VPAQVPEGRPVSGAVKKGENYYFKASAKKQKNSIEIKVSTLTVLTFSKEMRFTNIDTFSWYYNEENIRSRSRRGY